MYTFDAATHIHRFGPRIIPGATAILKDAGFEQHPGDMEKGRAVHLAAEFDDKGTLDMASVDDSVMGYLMAWRRFRAETGFKPARIEEPNVNSALLFAAVLDREGTWKLGKARVIVELKKYAPPYYTAIQTALQDLTLAPVTLPRQRIAVELREDGTYKIHRYDDPNDRHMALFLVSLYWYKRNNGQ